MKNQNVDIGKLPLGNVKRLYSIVGAEGVGKTTTLKKLIARLGSDKNFHVIFRSRTAAREWMAVYECRGIVIGISTAGDNLTIIRQNFEFFARHRCDIVIVPVRTKTGRGRPSPVIGLHEEIVTFWHLREKEKRVSWDHEMHSDSVQQEAVSAIYQQICAWGEELASGNGSREEK